MPHCVVSVTSATQKQARGDRGGSNLWYRTVMTIMTMMTMMTMMAMIPQGCLPAHEDDDDDDDDYDDDDDNDDDYDDDGDMVIFL